MAESEGISTEYLVDILSAIRVNTAMIPRIEVHLKKLNGSVQQNQRDIMVNRTDIQAASFAGDRREKRWKVILEWVLRILQALAVAGILIWLNMR